MSFLDKILKRPDDRQRAVDEYNKGLQAKYEGRWQQSFEHNRLAAQLNPEDEAAWWNLAIAATALHDWDEARRAWIACGVIPNESEGEVTTPENWACVRLVPDDSAEVVWGKRIDPARIRIMNIPLPESDRLYGDIILNDGAQEGTRVSNGTEYPVFNELQVWRRSDFSTFRVEVVGATAEAKSTLERLCEESGLHFEDWGTVRRLCATCSRGNPGPHDCSDVSQDDRGIHFGIAARAQDSVARLLAEWREIEPDIQCTSPVMTVCGVNR